MLFSPTTPRLVAEDESMEEESFGPNGAEAPSTPHGRKRPSDTSVKEAEFASGSGRQPDPRSPVPELVRHSEELETQRSDSHDHIMDNTAIEDTHVVVNNVLNEIPFQL
eukprot:15303522-Heterocapsa_arctica.AAC.1